MGDYPPTPYFIGLNAPVRTELTLDGLPVEGILPPEVRGAFFRAVPDPAFPPKFADDHTLSGDGMISRVRFNADGTADYAIRFVETARHKAEREVGRARFGKYRNPFTDDADVAGSIAPWPTPPRCGTPGGC
jgi:carotenoid cleavage dioxygenase